MSEQSSTIEALADSYAESLYEGDAERLRVIFDPTCDLRWSEKGQLQTLSVVEWLKRVEKRPSAKAQGHPRDNFIVTIDRSDENTGMIKIRLRLPPASFHRLSCRDETDGRLENRVESLSTRGGGCKLAPALLLCLAYFCDRAAFHLRP
jgi:hypothetical protein